MYSCEVVEKWVTNLFTLKSVAVGKPRGELTVNIHMTMSSFRRINQPNLEIELRGKVSEKSGHKYKKTNKKISRKQNVSWSSVKSIFNNRKERSPYVNLLSPPPCFKC